MNSYVRFLISVPVQKHRACACLLSLAPSFLPSPVLTCRFVIRLFRSTFDLFLSLSRFFFVIIGGTAYHVLFIDARNFFGMPMTDRFALAVSELITERASERETEYDE